MSPRRWLTLALASAALLAAAPARAAQEAGSIVVPTFGSPGVPRIAYATAGLNGIAGHVFALPVAGRPFTLRGVTRPTGLEDFDITFYAALDSAEPIVSFATATDEAGTIPAGARWAVVTMSAGANGTFLFTSV